MTRGVSEEQRLTDSKVDLEEAQLERLNQKLNLITDVLADGQYCLRRPR